MSSRHAHYKPDHYIQPSKIYHFVRPPLFTCYSEDYTDAIAVEWKDLRVMELPGTGWCAIIGHKRQEVRSLPLKSDKPRNRE
jgi:hypothetical protein